MSPTLSSRGLGRTAVLIGLALFSSCTGRSGPDLIRLAPPASAGAPVAVAAGLAVGSEPVEQTVSVDASRVVRLSFRAAGDATLLELAWRVAAERSFSRFRNLTISLLADGAEHAYEVDLRREPYWTGRVVALRWSARGGTVRLAPVTGEDDPGAVRVTSLKGLSLPSLPGRRRSVLTLPAALPRRPYLETRLGLLPKYDLPGVVARFRAEVVGSGAPRVLLDEEVRGGAREGWQPVRVPLAATPGDRLSFEVTASRRGEDLPEGAAVWASPVVVSDRGPAPGLDLVVVLIDTLRADAVGAYGRKPSFTPTLDALAARSVRFAELLSPAPWTLPSVAALLTGLPPEVHGAGRRLGDFAPTALGRGPTTLAGALAAHGYWTSAVYDNIYLSPSFGLERGFDEYRWVDADDAVLVDRALEDLDRHRDRRQFLFLHLFGPHNPYQPPAEECARVARAEVPGYRGPLGCSADRRPGNPVPPPSDRPWIEALYHADVAWTDRQLGRFLAGLREAGLAHRTVLLVVSDHGEDFWGREGELEERGYEDADHGHTQYQEMLHVVGLLSAPELVPRVVDDPVEMVDLYPTLFRLLGLVPPASEGIDLSGVLAGGRMPRRTLLSSSILHGPARWSVRRGPWKLIVPEEPGLAVELYDLAEDPGERHDLAALRPDLVRALRAVGERERKRREELRRKVNVGGDALAAAYLEWNHITKLRALGYLH